MIKRLTEWCLPKGTIEKAFMESEVREALELVWEKGWGKVGRGGEVKEVREEEGKGGDGCPDEVEE